MTIRLLTPDDAEAYWILRLEALEREPEAFSADAEEHRHAGIETTRARLSNPAGFVVGAFAGGQLAGSAGFFREQGLKERHKGRIWGVYVKAELRGRGIGAAMLRALLEQARSNPGIEQIVLSVTTTQHAAVRLYESLGFERFGRERHALKVRGTYLDEDYMALFLR